MRMRTPLFSKFDFAYKIRWEFQLYYYLFAHSAPAPIL